MRKEIGNWLKYRAVQVVHSKATDEAKEGDQRENVMKMKWLLTRKEDGTAKARLIVLGFQDRDLAELQSASPTASRRARNLLLLQTSRNKWQLRKGDVTAAFLQGKKDEEKREKNTSKPHRR